MSDERKLVQMNKKGAISRTLYFVFIMPCLLGVAFVAGTKFDLKRHPTAIEQIARIRPSLMPSSPDGNPSYWIRLRGSSEEFLWRPSVTDEDRISQLQEALDQAHERLRQLDKAGNAAGPLNKPEVPEEAEKDD